jgi:hypothetical protein
VDERPQNPNQSSAHLELAALQNGEILTDNRHVAPVSVPKGFFKLPPCQARREHTPHESALLNSDLCHAGQRVLMPNHGRRISNDEDIRLPWNVE